MGFEECLGAGKNLGVMRWKVWIVELVEWILLMMFFEVIVGLQLFNHELDHVIVRDQIGTPLKQSRARPHIADFQRASVQGLMCNPSSLLHCMQKLKI